MTPTHRYFNYRKLNQDLPCEKIDGIMLPQGVKAQNVRDLRQSLTLRSDDVFIVTYPKSGTTWMQQIVKLIRNDGIEDGSDIDTVLPWIDAMMLDEVEVLPSPRGFKTHLPYHCIAGGEPAAQAAKYIYVYRNPKDVLVSNYHFMGKFLPHDIPWSSFFELWLSPNSCYGNLLDHVKEWYEHRDARNIILISYEDLKKNPYTNVRKIANFLGHKLDDATVGKIVEESSFRSMRDKPFCNNEWMCEYRRGGTRFMRKGEIGDWKNLFSAEQSEQIGKLVEEKLGKTDMVYDWE